MMKRRLVLILRGMFTGTIMFAICVFFIPPYVALLFGIYMAVMSAREYDAAHELIGQKILLKGKASYYSDNPVYNGILYLTKDSLIFISNKNHKLRERIWISSIKSAEQGLLCGSITGLKIVLNDGSEIGFTVRKAEEYTAKINELMDFASSDKKERIDLAEQIIDYLGCACEIIEDAEDFSVITKKYESLLVRSKKEGFIPLFIVPSESMCEIVETESEDSGDNSSLGDIIEFGVKEINAAEYLNERIDEVMSTIEYEDFDFMGEFSSHGPVNTFNSLYDPIAHHPYEVIIIAKIPTDKPWELAAWIPMGGWNECPGPEEQVAVFKYWHEKYGAFPVAVSDDIWEMYVEKPPTTKDEAVALAKDQFGFCSDIVLQGTESINALASTLVNSKVWYFWWD